MADPFSGVGDSSIAGMKAAAAKSGLCPPLIDTSDYRPGGPYHGTSNATDWSNGGDAGTPEMDQFAAWVASNYGAYSLEIIHVNRDGSTVEWKNGVKQATGFYPQATLAQHKNHVHWAIANPGLEAAGAPSVNADTSNLQSGTIKAEGTVDTGVGGVVGSLLGKVFQPVVNYAIDAGMVIGGLACLLFGAMLIFSQTSTGKKTTAVATGLVKARAGMG